MNDVGGHRTLIRSETRCGAPRVVHRARGQVTRTTRTVVTDEYVPYTTTVTRDYYSAPVRGWDEDVYYGSSYPWPRPRYEIGY